MEHTLKDFFTRLSKDKYQSNYANEKNDEDIRIQLELENAIKLARDMQEKAKEWNA